MKNIVQIYARRVGENETPHFLDIDTNLVPLHVDHLGNLKVALGSEVTLSSESVHLDLETLPEDTAAIKDALMAGQNQGTGEFKVEGMTGMATVPPDTTAIKNSTASLDAKATTVVSDLGNIKTATETSAGQSAAIATSTAATAANTDVSVDRLEEVSANTANVDINTAAIQTATENMDARLAAAQEIGGTPLGVRFDPGLLDQFSRLRTTTPFTLFESAMLYDKRIHKWSELTAGSAACTHGGNVPVVYMDVTAASGSRAVRQTYYYVPYQPGKSKMCLLTGILNTSPKANVVSRLGIFDDHNDKLFGSGGDGVFFELNGTTPYVVVRSYTTGAQVDTKVAQANWNIDKMDGTGNSGISLDFSKCQIFVIDLEWLGVGSVTFGVVLNRKMYFVHRFDHANTVTQPYMRRASLPVRFEIANTAGTIGPSRMLQICSSVMSEGGFIPAGITFSANSGIVDRVVASSVPIVPLLAVRLKPGDQRAMLSIGEIEVVITGALTVLVEVYSGPGLTLTGSVWTDVHTESFAQYDTSVTAFSGGIKRFSGYVTSTVRTINMNTYGEPLVAFTDIQGNPQPIVVCAKPTSGNANLLAAMTWQEFS